MSTASPLRFESRIVNTISQPLARLATHVYLRSIVAGDNNFTRQQDHEYRMARLAQRVALRQGIMTLAKWFGVLGISWWGIVRTAEAFTGETTTVDIDIKIALVVTATLAVTVAAQEAHRRQQKKELIRLRKRVDGLETAKGRPKGVEFRDHSEGDQ